MLSRAGAGAAVPGVRAAVEPRPGRAEGGGLDEDHGGGRAGELQLRRVAACSTAVLIKPDGLFVR